MAITFGISFAPNHPKEFMDWCRTAEETGFERVGVVDSQSIYRELYVSCTAGLQATKRVKLGPRVTNSQTRHLTVTASAMLAMYELAPERVFVGVGTGDSALHNIGLRPVRLSVLEEFVGSLRRLMRGEPALVGDRELRLTWGGGNVPIYVAAHGPKTLESAGRCADGIVFGNGVGEDVVRDTFSAIAAGAARSRRKVEDLDVWWGLSASVADSREEALAQIRMLLAAKANHLASFPNQNKQVPPRFRAALDQINREYNYLEHQKPGAGTTNARLVRESGLEDYLAERYAIVGTPEECVATLRRMEKWGVRKVWLNVHFDDKIGFMKRWSKEVMSQVA